MLKIGFDGSKVRWHVYSYEIKLVCKEERYKRYSSQILLSYRSTRRVKASDSVCNKYEVIGIDDHHQDLPISCSVITDKYFHHQCQQHTTQYNKKQNTGTFQQTMVLSTIDRALKQNNIDVEGNDRPMLNVYLATNGWWCKEDQPTRRVFRTHSHSVQFFKHCPCLRGGGGYIRRYQQLKKITIDLEWKRRVIQHLTYLWHDIADSKSLLTSWHSHPSEKTKCFRQWRFLAVSLSCSL